MPKMASNGAIHAVDEWIGGLSVWLDERHCTMAFLDSNGGEGGEAQACFE